MPKASTPEKEKERKDKISKKLNELYATGKKDKKIGQHHSPKTEFKKGTCVSPSTQFKKGNTINCGENNPMYGKTDELCHLYVDGRSKKPGYRSFMARKRKIIKRNAEGSHTLGDWETLKAQYNWTCPCCLKKEPEITLTEDHIIPLSKGGSNNIENIQPLCRSCNSKKNNKIIEKYKYEGV